MTEVDFTGHRVRPPHVLKAVLLDDKASLREYGRRGAVARARKAVHADPATNTKIHQFLESERLFLGTVRSLDCLRDRWAGVQRFMRSHRNRLPQKLTEEVRTLREAFVSRGRWIVREMEMREEFEELARARNEHICPID